MERIVLLKSEENDKCSFSIAYDLWDNVIIVSSTMYDNSGKKRVSSMVVDHDDFLEFAKACTSLATNIKDKF